MTNASIRLLRRCQLAIECAIDQNEQDVTRAIRPIAPGMISAALNKNIARLQQHLGIVEHTVDLAGKNNHVVYGFRSMHQWVAATLAKRRSFFITQRRKKLS